MSDAKERYSDGVATRKIEALADQDLMDKIAKGIQRANAHKHKWESVNINDVVETFAPNAEPIYQNGKIHGRNKSEYNRATHFRIKKREEM